jgi:hypothetical protein
MSDAMSAGNMVARAAAMLELLSATEPSTACVALSSVASFRGRQALALQSALQGSTALFCQHYPYSLQQPAAGLLQWHHVHGVLIPDVWWTSGDHFASCNSWWPKTMEDTTINHLQI